jgi:hypothetical protein
MECGEVWLQNDNIIDLVGRLLEALDAERLAIATAIDLQARTLRPLFLCPSVLRKRRSARRPGHWRRAATTRRRRRRSKPAM